MSYKEKTYDNVVTKCSSFVPAPQAVEEWNVLLTIVDGTPSFESQCRSMQHALQQLQTEVNAIPVFCKFFLSDAANQQPMVEERLSGLINCCQSYVQQPPANGTKLAVWLQMQSEAEVGKTALNYYEHNHYRHYRSSATMANLEGVYAQTEALLNGLEKNLQSEGCCVRDHCVRTWFHVRDIDAWYSGVVEGRKSFFAAHGLTSETHYIASTGIGGGQAQPQQLVSLDSHCIKGLQPAQIRYLYASTHLNPTAEYGVTFERGVAVDYGDRRNIYISGTASIDNKGQILFPGHVLKQCERACSNVEALLAEVDCALTDASLIIVYLRDPADAANVSRFYSYKFPTVPCLIVLAPVCRPGWLVEMECIAQKPVDNSPYANY